MAGDAKIKGVFFDMDGVLIDAREWHYEALNRALGLFGQAISRYDHLVTYNGLPTKRKLAMLTEERGLPKGLHDFINDLKQQYTIEIIHAKCKPVFMHEYAISRLKKEGYTLALCSNSVRPSVELMMEKAGLAGYFDFYLSNQDVENGKPHPEIYLKAIQQAKLIPSQCLVIEDNPNGVKAAKESGAHVLEVAGVEEVSYDNISRRISEIEGRKTC